MNYDNKYDIRLAQIDDIVSIMNFINVYWKKGHILGTNRKLFEYEHVDGNKVNFLLAVDRTDNSIVGILGFILASHNLTKLDVWTGIWKVKSGEMPLLGMEMYKRLSGMISARSLLGVGDNQATTGFLLRKLTRTFNIWRMDHYYFLAKRENYKLAKITHMPVYSNSSEVETTALKLNKIDDVKELVGIFQCHEFPHKDLWYIEHRYFNHPLFKYHIYGLKRKQQKAIIIFRIQECNGSGALRIVDYIGNQNCFSGINKFISDCLEIYNCEYADFYVHGFNKNCIMSAGFCERTENDSNIIPNYFSPYEQRNIEIYVSGNINDVLFCKADGDQDRPN